MALRIIPLLLVLGLLAFFGLRLVQIEEDPNKSKQPPSVLIGKPVPEFELPGLLKSDSTFSRQDLLGKVSLVVVWASWCPTCVEEQPLLLYLAKNNIVDLYGLNYSDDHDDAVRWIRRFGNPWHITGFDPDGKVANKWGVTAAPETYVIDKKGMIRAKYISAISGSTIQQELLPLIAKLKQEPD